jgi:hypothetical protein
MSELGMYQVAFYVIRNLAKLREQFQSALSIRHCKVKGQGNVGPACIAHRQTRHAHKATAQLLTLKLCPSLVS